MNTPDPLAPCPYDLQAAALDRAEALMAEAQGLFESALRLCQVRDFDGAEEANRQAQARMAEANRLLGDDLAPVLLADVEAA